MNNAFKVFNKTKKVKITGIKSQKDYNDRIMGYALEIRQDSRLSMSDCIRLAVKKLGRYEDITAPVKHIPPCNE